MRWSESAPLEIAGERMSGIRGIWKPRPLPAVGRPVRLGRDRRGRRPLRGRWSWWPFSFGMQAPQILPCALQGASRACGWRCAYFHEFRILWLGPYR